MKLKRLAIIPARGGSKRIPKKNIKDFYGKPIITRVLDEVSKTGLFDEIHVSTDDIEIAEVVARAGFEPLFMRNSDLADDFTPLSEVLKFVVERYRSMGKYFDTFGLVFATAVMLDAKTLFKAVNFYENTDNSLLSSQLISVAKYPAPIEWAMHMNEGGELIPVDRRSLSIRSQDLNSAWHETADFVLYKENGICSNEGNTLRRGFPIPHISVDIDDIEDWERAEMIYKVKKSKVYG